MTTVEREIDRYLVLLRNKIREQGFTQCEIQDVLGWGDSYISQLLTKQKTLRLDQVLSILQVIGIEPKEFFAKLHVPRAHVVRKRPTAVSGRSWQELERLSTLLKSLADLLRKKGVFTAKELSRAAAASETGVVTGRRIHNQHRRVLDSWSTRLPSTHPVSGLARGVRS